MLKSSLLSTRAASWTAAQCVRHFCYVRGISDPDIEAFCAYLEDSARADSIVEWDARAKKLSVSGLGDALPSSLASIHGLEGLLCCAHEITASEMYGAWRPNEVLKHLCETAERSGLDAAQVVSVACSLQTPGANGWGYPVTEAERESWLDRVSCLALRR